MKVDNDTAGRVSVLQTVPHQQERLENGYKNGKSWCDHMDYRTLQAIQISGPRQKIPGSIAARH